MSKKRKRDILTIFYVNEDENNLIETKMQQAEIKNKSAYLRKMAIDGYVIKQDFKTVKKFIYELNKIGININQIAKVANTYGADTNLQSDIAEIRKDINKIWQQLTLKD